MHYGLTARFERTVSFSSDTFKKDGTLEARRADNRVVRTKVSAILYN